MKIIFDQGTPAPLRHALVGHTVSALKELGWGALSNGALLAAAESQFDVLVTTDKNLRHQQNLRGRRLAVLVLPTTSWPMLKPSQARIAAAIDAIQPGDLIEFSWSDVTEVTHRL